LVKKKINLTIVADKKCMEIEMIDNSDTIFFLSAKDSNFQGFYLGVRVYIPLWWGKRLRVGVGPIGSSVLLNLYREVRFRKGSILFLDSLLHLRTQAEIKDPAGKYKKQKSSMMLTYIAAKEITGNWLFRFRYGIGSTFPQEIVLFYMDADPHCEYEFAPRWK
jgi:hypothetical protein